MGKLRGFLLKYFLFRFFNSLLFLYPVMAIMFSANGVSDIGLSVLFSFWSATVILFLPLVGYLGDRYSRHAIMMSGNLACAAAFIVFIVFPNFFGYLFGFLLWGYKWAVDGSTGEAFLYDELKTMGARRLYLRISSKASAIGYFALLLGSVGSFIAARFGYEFVSGITAIAMLIAASCFAIIVERQAKSHMRAPHRSHWMVLKQIRAGFSAIKNVKYLMMSVILVAAAGSLAYMDDLVPKLSMEYGIDMAYVGLVLGAISIANMIGNFFAEAFAKIKWRALVFGMAMIGAAFAFFPVVGKYGFLITMFLCGFVYAVTSVNIRARIQAALPSNRRARACAFIELAGNAIQIAFYGIIALGATMSGYKLGFAIIGLVVLAIGLITFLHTKQPKLVQSPKSKVQS